MLIPHRWPGAPIAAVLLERENRFLARCRIPARAGRSVAQVVRAHVPDRGRCLDLLLPGQPVVLVAASGPHRTTDYTLLLARAKSAPRTWVSIDPAGAPRLVAAAVADGLLFPGRSVVAREVAQGRSRIDLLLSGNLLCEVKSVGAARDGVALFPDAPTERGTRHLALLAARAQGAARRGGLLRAARRRTGHRARRRHRPGLCPRARARPLRGSARQGPRLLGPPARDAAARRNPRLALAG